MTLRALLKKLEPTFVSYLGRKNLELSYHKDPPYLGCYVAQLPI